MGRLTADEDVMSTLHDVLAPLVEADGGELYLVDLGKRELRLHLAGRFAGCPGNALVERRVIEPLIRSVHRELAVKVTSGSLIPSGAQRIEVTRATAPATPAPEPS